MRFLNDYDYFNVGETWYMETDKEHIYVNIGEDDTDLLEFRKGSEIVIHDIDKESGYGMAFITIEGYETHLSLDELFGMVFAE